jgi:O-antigen ligase
VVIGSVIAALALVQPYAGLDLGADPGDWAGRIAGTLGSPPQLAACLSVILFLVGCEVFGASRLWREAAVAASVVICVALVFTFTRAALVGVVCGLVIVGLGCLRRRPGVGLGLLLLVGVVAAAGPQLILRLSDDPRLREDTNAIGRVETSELSWQLFSERPIFGWGPLTINNFSATSGYGDWVSHNSFLTLLVATGAVGGLLYLTPIALAAAPSLGQGAADVGRWRVAAAAGAVAYVINALAIDMRYFSFPHTLFWLCLGLLWTTGARAPNPPR